ncbi:HesA/MoeB/ThiF family protein [Shewanella maritima]|uniref:HesA/MoeB/ThiF family protein n=1 Tax=Shewanella maritima TaxID=2520507 RepID=UPI003735A600
MLNQLTATQYIQYSKQILLPEIGETGQIALLNANVTVVGLGGLGTLVAQYLAAAGVASLTLIDGDQVERDNLPRQLIYAESDLTKAKVDVCAMRLSDAYLDVTIVPVKQMLDVSNVDSLIPNTSKLIIDCTDNLAVRQVINRFCVNNKKTLINGAINHGSGQVFCFNFAKHTSAGCYTCFVPLTAKVEQSCATSGVLGPAVGMIASFQAKIAIEHITESFNQYGQLFRFNVTDNSWVVANLNRDPACSICRHHYLGEAS